MGNSGDWAMVFDPAALEDLSALFQKFVGDHIRVYLWHPTLDATRPLRDALGLRENRSHFSGFIEKSYCPCRRTQ